MRPTTFNGRRSERLVQLRFSFEPLPAPPADGASAVEPLFVRHRRARRYVLRLTPDGRPRVTIPRGGSKREASAFLARQAEWIARQQQRLAARRQHAERAWETGDWIWFRGVLTPVRLLATGGRLRVAIGSQLVDVDGGVTVKSAVEQHLRALATLELPERLHHLAASQGLAVSRVMVRDQQTRWGSCSPLGAISLNWRLVQMPDAVRDYVLVHELMHLREASHSRRFWRLVNAACPGHLEARRWLRRHGHDLHQPIAGRPATDGGAPAPQGVDRL